ncbi:MAG: response regulator, partial [Bacteroidota bacterium]
MFDIPSKILLAEDDESLGMLLQDFLELEGYEVTRANDGQEAVHLFRTNPFDLVVLDVMMPQKDGLTAAREIRGENKEIPIVFLTAKNMKEDMYKGFEAGGDDYITKPFDETELAFRIEALLKRAKPAGDQPVEFPIGEFMFD